MAIVQWLQIPRRRRRRLRELMALILFTLAVAVAVLAFEYAVVSAWMLAARLVP